MHSPRLLFLCLIVLMGFAFTSCEEQTDMVPTTIEPLSDEEYLRLGFHPPVLFQYAIHDRETDKLHGFTIDRSGAIRTFFMEETPYEYKQYQVINVVAASLEKQIEISEETDLAVDISELAMHTKALRRSGTHQLLREPSDAEERYTETFYAFGLANRHQSRGGCQTGGSTSTSLTGFSQIPLLSTGYHNLVSNSVISTEIVEWLKEGQPFKEAQLSLALQALAGS